MCMNNKNYSQLIKLNSFEERFKYLILDGVVGKETFGCDRYLNQHFYNSVEWRHLRHQIIVRDQGCDLGLADYPIYGQIIVHHIVPITLEMIYVKNPIITDPDNLICVSHNTHNAITYNDLSYLLQMSPQQDRCANDTCPWRH